MKCKAIVTVLFALLITGFCNAKGNKTLLVADRKIPCAGNFECIQIKEKEKARWRVYSDTIEGFNYEEGYQYKISVLPLQTLNTLSGLYEEKYKLLKVISKKKTDYNPANKLGDKKWVLHIMDDTKNKFTLKDTSVVLQFSLKDGRLKGKGPCNSFTGFFTRQAEKLTITNITSTKMLCQSEQLEKLLFTFYNNITTYQISGNILTLYKPDGENLVFEGR
jgi:heat shock protein HslJ